MTTIRLGGCTTGPLLAYLKAMGLLAVLAEQADPAVTGWWEHGRFHLSSDELETVDDVVDFLATSWAPLPIVSPWNSRGGFRTDRSQTGEKGVAELEVSTDSRLEPYRRTIRATRRVWADADALGLLAGGSVDTKRKEEFVRLCRGRLPDEALQWIDATVVLLDGDVSYPDLLGGTGGNLGSGDLSSAAHHATLWLVEHAKPHAYLRHALLGGPSPKLDSLLVGQLDPGGAGGINMGPSGLVNPVDLLLGLHGASLFAAGVARRLDGSKATSVPFTLRVDPGATRTLADGEKVRAELWLPEWRRPVTIDELKLLLAEGRAQWSGRQSSSSLDFARAAASLGVDRDITHFSRYLIAERLGQSNLAVPVGRFDVGERRGAQLTSAIDPFLRSVGRVPNPSQAVHGAANRLRRRIMALAERDEAGRARAVLAALFDLEAAVGRSSSAREHVVRPVPALRVADWLPLLHEDSPEFRLAVSIASQREHHRDHLGRRSVEAGSFPTLSRPVRRTATRGFEAQGTVDLFEWSGESAVADLAAPDPRTALRAAWRHRALRCSQHPERERGESESSDVVETPGVDVAFAWSIPAAGDDLIAFGMGDVDERSLGEWLRALVMLDWSTPPDRLPARPAGGSVGLLGPAFVLNAPFFQSRPVRIDGRDQARSVRFVPTAPHLAAMFRADLEAATEHAAKRLRQFGLDVPIGLKPRHARSALDAALVPAWANDVRRALTPMFRSSATTEADRLDQTLAEEQT